MIWKDNYPYNVNFTRSNYYFNGQENPQELHFMAAGIQKIMLERKNWMTWSEKTLSTSNSGIHLLPPEVVLPALLT